MSNVFKNPLVISEVVVGSIIDTRAVVFYEQPENYNANSNLLYEKDEDGNVKLDANGSPIVSDLMQLVDKRQLKEIFTGFEVPVISKINGMNIYGISYMSADIDISSDLCDHPVESGSVITDNAIINPIAMKVKVALPTAFATRIYEQMIKFYQKKKYIMVQTKFAMYRNMVIEAMPFKLENETVDRPVVELSLRQIQEVEVQYITGDAMIKNPLNSEDSDTKDLGRKQAATVVETLGL